MNLKYIRILIAILLCLALLKLPIGYYTFLRIFIMVISLILVYKANDLKKQSWLIIFLSIAILFNPIIPIYFQRETWAILDIIVAIIFLISVRYFKFERVITEERYLEARKRIEEKKKNRQ